MQSLINTQEFLALSSFLNYQLSAIPVNWRGILNLMVDDRLEQIDEELLAEALVYLGNAYGEQKRRLGPFAVLHPIRAAALLAMAEPEPSTLNILTTLLHDKNEDILPEDFSEPGWQKLEGVYQELVGKIDRQTSSQLHQWLYFLTKQPGERYYEYLARLFAQGRETPGLIRVKLADRLDNTLDLRIDLSDASAGSDCYQVIFDILFANAYQGLPLKKPHPIARKINGAMRLYQLYKNAVFLSLLRGFAIPLDEVGQRLFVSLARAGISEAQNIMLHNFAYHIQEPGQQRRLLREVMEYAAAGGLEYVNVEGRHRLDGLFLCYFDHKEKAARNRSLAALYEDKELMSEAAVAFMSIFANFLHDPAFTIRGISATGLSAGNNTPA